MHHQAQIQDPYQRKGYKNRKEYLRRLAEDYGVPLSKVLLAAEVLGPEEDFDALVSTVNDLSDLYM